MARGLENGQRGVSKIISCPDLGPLSAGIALERTKLGNPTVKVMTVGAADLSNITRTSGSMDFARRLGKGLVTDDKSPNAHGIIVVSHVGCDSDFDPLAGKVREAVRARHNDRELTEAEVRRILDHPQVGERIMENVLLRAEGAVTDMLGRTLGNNALRQIEIFPALAVETEDGWDARILTGGPIYTAPSVVSRTP
jgi:hypothetical protein